MVFLHGARPVFRDRLWFRSYSGNGGSVSTRQTKSYDRDLSAVEPRPRNHERRDMADLKKWTAVTVAGAVLSLGGVIGLGSGLSGAAQPNDALSHSNGAVSPGATPIAPNIYKWFINGVKAASITISTGSFSSTLGTNDSGKFIQAGRTFGLSITSGADALYGCVFAGHVNAKGTGVSSAAKPGNWVCPNFGSGTFYIKAGASATTPLNRSAYPLGRDTGDCRLGRSRYPQLDLRGRRGHQDHHVRREQHLHQYVRLGQGHLGPSRERRRPEHHRRPRREQRLRFGRKGQHHRYGDRNRREARPL